MSDEIQKLAHFAAQTQLEQIPAAVQQHAKLVILDMLGVMLAGSEQPEVCQLRERLCATGGTGATVLARGWPGADARTAALLNGTAGRSIELCENHPYVKGQGAAQVLPGVFAVGESAHSTGREILTAFIVGYDLAIRFSRATKARPIAHPNGQSALLGAVAAGARLRGLTAAQTSLALRIGATLMVAPSHTNGAAGATVLNVAGGMSGFAAALAPELALSGFAAQDQAIDESLGSLVAEGFDRSKLIDELGSRWEITSNHFRLRACCNPIYAALDALEESLATLQPRPDEIEKIDVVTYRFAAIMSNKDPANYFASKYSLPHAAAALVLKGGCGYGSFIESVVHDPAIAALRQRVHITEDPGLTAMVPKLKPARVTITLKDGRQTTHMCESAKGDFERLPNEESEVRKKFRELAGLVLTEEGVAAVEKTVDACEQWPSMNALTDPLRRHSRPKG